MRWKQQQVTKEMKKNINEEQGPIGERKVASAKGWKHCSLLTHRHIGAEIPQQHFVVRAARQPARASACKENRECQTLRERERQRQRQREAQRECVCGFVCMCMCVYVCVCVCMCVSGCVCPSVTHTHTLSLSPTLTLSHSLTHSLCPLYARLHPHVPNMAEHKINGTKRTLLFRVVFCLRGV